MIHSVQTSLPPAELPPTPRGGIEQPDIFPDPSPSPAAHFHLENSVTITQFLKSLLPTSIHTNSVNFMELKNSLKLTEFSICATFAHCFNSVMLTELQNSLKFREFSRSLSPLYICSNWAKLSELEQSANLAVCLNSLILGELDNCPSFEQSSKSEQTLKFRVCSNWAKLAELSKLAGHPKSAKLAELENTANLAVFSSTKMANNFLRLSQHFSQATMETKMTLRDNVPVPYEELTREQAISLLAIHNSDGIQREQVIGILIEKFSQSKLSDQQRSDLEMFTKAINQLDHWTACAVRKLFGCEHTIN